MGQTDFWVIIIVLCLCVIYLETKLSARSIALKGKAEIIERFAAELRAMAPQTLSAHAPEAVGRGCQTCIFHSPSSGCHRFPPIHVSGYVRHPAVSHNDWCGEHRPETHHFNGRRIADDTTKRTT